jgi:hypothetical protein
LLQLSSSFKLKDGKTAWGAILIAGGAGFQELIFSTYPHIPSEMNFS